MEVKTRVDVLDQMAPETIQIVSSLPLVDIPFHLTKESGHVLLVEFLCVVCTSQSTVMASLMQACTR